MVLGPAGESMNLRRAPFDAAELAADAIMYNLRTRRRKYKAKVSKGGVKYTTLSYTH